MGHNPGPFTPIADARAGQAVFYWDATGVEHPFVIATVTRQPHDHADESAQDGSFPHLVLVTCAVPDGSIDWVVVAQPT
jgi:sortase (surface protein transpeptidase)